MPSGPSYLRVFLTFARNSLVRNMTFRGNFLIETFSSMSWVFMNLGFYILVFQHTPRIGDVSNWGEYSFAWGKYEFFLFLSTTLMVNSLVQALFMENASEFGEMIRTGTLDFALLKPIDTQFLISLQRIDWSSLGNLVVGIGLAVFSLHKIGWVPSVWQVLLFMLFVICGVAIMYSLMIALAATSIWLGRNQSLYNFWFYITNFSRYPMEIYRGTYGTPLRMFFTFIIPVLVVVNVPARFLVRPLVPQTPMDLLLPVFAFVATVASLVGSRWVFNRSLLSYRSASS
ncbi:MAG: ABC transporter permease [Planctomycetaceae bacterium]|nr:ABC transporter permease [Planctomycetaceae bacterium]